MSTSMVVKRILFSLLIGLLIGAIISEIPFLFLQETARSPQEILLTIPAGASEQVARGEQPPSIPENMAFECTFQSDNYLGLDVHQPLTLVTRIYGITYVGLPMAILIALYSLVIPT